MNDNGMKTCRVRYAHHVQMVLPTLSVVTFGIFNQQEILLASNLAFAVRCMKLGEATAHPTKIVLEAGL